MHVVASTEETSAKLDCQVRILGRFYFHLFLGTRYGRFGLASLFQSLPCCSLCRLFLESVHQASENSGHRTVWQEEKHGFGKTIHPSPRAALLIMRFLKTLRELKMMSRLSFLRMLL